MGRVEHKLLASKSLLKEEKGKCEEENKILSKELNTLQLEFIDVEEELEQAKIVQGIPVSELFQKT